MYKNYQLKTTSMWLFYYILEIIQETWWVALLMGLIAVVFMQFAPKKEEWESLDDYYNKEDINDESNI